MHRRRTADVFDEFELDLRDDGEDADNFERR
jgi:hypothetical protein